MDALFFIVIGIAMLAAVVWLLRRSAASRQPAVHAEALRVDELAARHCRFAPQLRQTLSSKDENFLQRRASASALREWRDSRRRVLREFLTGLHQDFERLNRMARAVSRLAPQLDGFREAELFWLGLRFWLIYRFAALELACGVRPAKAYLLLTGMIGGLGSALERAAAMLAEESALRRPPVLTS